MHTGYTALLLPCPAKKAVSAGQTQVVLTGSGWERVYGSPVVAAEIRRTPSDFQVVEELGFEPSANGEHDFLCIEKVDANTEWLARQLARHAKLASRDVGYCGLKDRHAITRQWFSVRRPNRDGTDWQKLNIDGVRILDIRRNARKLRRGAHRSNFFRIAMRGDGIGTSAEALRERIAIIANDGIPNYFGEQRFGHNGGNLSLAKALFAGKRLRRDKRGFALSAARAFLFNKILERRIVDGSWNQLLAGELANLDGTASVFAVEDPSPELASRCRELDVHPTATLWGDAAPLAKMQAAAVEVAAIDEFGWLTAGLEDAQLEPASRALRLRVHDIDIQASDDLVWIEFRLSKGAYATAVLRELVAY